MAVIFVSKSQNFYLLDHGEALVLPSPPQQGELQKGTIVPIPGLFHQPKQYFKTKHNPENHNICRLLNHLQYPPSEETEGCIEERIVERCTEERIVEENTVIEGSKRTRDIERNTVSVSADKDHQAHKKQRKIDRFWLSTGTVPPYKNNCFAESCCLSGSLFPYPVELNKAISSTSSSSITVKHGSLFNRFTANTSRNTIRLCADDEVYFLPPDSAFLMSDITTFQTFPGMFPRYKYHLIVMDPPWSNKSVKRARSYDMLSTNSGTTLGAGARAGGGARRYEKIGYMFDNIPVSDLLLSGGILGIWVTNKPAHIAHVLNVLLPRWGVQLVGAWFWLKITNSGVPVVPFESPHKKPYELLFISRKDTEQSGRHWNEKDIEHLIDFPFEALEFPENGYPEQALTSQLPPKVVISSVPCVQHSRKPPLGKVLEHLLPSNPKCLEIFARNLNSGWHSWGNETLLFQNSKFFEL